MPECRWVSSADINDLGMIAAWQKPSAQYPSGCIELDEEHTVIVGQIEYWQKQYPVAWANDMKKLVMDAYEDVAIAKVSHMHALTGTDFSEEQRDAMLLKPGPDHVDARPHQRGRSDCSPDRQARHQTEGRRSFGRGRGVQHR